MTCIRREGMHSFVGKSVCKGIAIGPACVVRKKAQQIEKKQIEDSALEIKRLTEAVNNVKQQLLGLYEMAQVKMGQSSAAIFESYHMILEDEEYINKIQSMISEEKWNAEYAVRATGEMFAQMLSAIGDDYMAARAADIADVSERLVCNLCGSKETIKQLKEPAVIVADDLTPGETVQLDRDKVLAFVTVQGVSYSHTAILAKMMNIPALVAVPLDLDQISDHTMILVDAFSGKVTLNPDRQTLDEAKQKADEKKEEERLLQQLRGKKNVTLDGHEVEIYANISSVEEIEQVIANDAGGIGLFRSEALFLGRKKPPSEEEQLEVYKQIATRMDGKKVIIRTLDVGADKQVEYLDLEKEENPALGNRGIRICLAHPELFKTQLRALFCAAAYGNIEVMYPMITSVHEVEQIGKLTQEVEQELKARGVAYKVPKQGVMIETPAAVMMSEELAQAVDFFSIGTNDLTQYTYAIDRQNSSMNVYFDLHLKAIWKMIEYVTENAHKYGKKVGICGELASDTQLTGELLQMGIDELSVVPSKVLELRKTIRDMRVG